MVGLDVHDVVVFCHRPVRPEHAVLAIVPRGFLAQPVEIRPERIRPEQLGMADVDIFKRNGIGLVPCRALTGIAGGIDGSVHRASPGGPPPWLAPEARLLSELHPVARARARESLPHLAPIQPRPPSQQLGLVTSLFPNNKAVREDKPQELR